MQLNLGTDADGRNTVAPAPIHYWGPLIRARRGRPVRIRFVNQLSPGEAGDLFLPVDTTTTGAGTGPDGGDEVYPTSRVSLHLHGGLTPWISGGTQYQWVSPAGERSPYRSGPALVNVPDMWFDAGGRVVPEGTPGATNDPGQDATTLYFPNDQSARFLYLHDDTYGLTRLNVYAGQAAPYSISDEVEDELVGGNTAEPSGSRIIPTEVAAGTVPAAELPLVIEDKSFVPATDKLRATDPTWDLARWGGLGALWYPHVYMPNQNSMREQGRVSDQPTINAMGRWNYLPWYWSGYEGTENGPVPNPLFGTVPSQPTEIPGTPNLSAVPNAFHDTMLVNGTAYPYVRVGRKAYRLRILNACGDRQLNLQLFFARSDEVAEAGPDGSPELQTDSGEVQMLPALPPSTGGWPARWPVDTRVGGVPDPRAAGPAMIQIGNDGGLLPQAVTHKPTPVGLERRLPTDQEASMGEYPSVIAVTTKALYLAPGERADVIVDFSRAPAGSKLILYNDAPAPAPNGDSRVDYYTGDRDQTTIGGAPATQVGYGPNTRTIMQFQVEGPAAERFDLEALRRVLPAAYAASQDPVLVPATGYAEAYGDELTPAGDGQDAPAAEEGTAEDTSLKAAPQEDAGTLTFTPLGRAYRLTLPVQGKMVSDLFVPAYGRLTGALGVDAPLSANGVRTAVPYSAIDPATEYLSPAEARSGAGDGRRNADLADHARRHRLAQRDVRRVRRPGPEPGAARGRGAPARPRRAGLEGHAARGPARVGAGRRSPGAARRALPASGQSARARRHRATRCGRGVHTARRAHGRAPAARDRECPGGPQLRGALEHPPHRRRGEPHRAADRAARDGGGAGGRDGDGRRRRRRHRLDGAALPAARRRVRAPAGRG